MLEQKFLDRFDMERRVHERLFCFGSGSEDAADDARASATPAQTDDEGRPLARGTTNLIDDSRQILPPQNDDPEPAPPVIGLADPEAAALRAPPDPNRPLTVAEEANLFNMFSERGLDPAAGQEDERQRQAQQQQALDAVNRMLGITTLPEAATAVSLPPAPVTVMGMEDEYDPFAGTGRTAMDIIGGVNYDTDDQSGPAGRIRPFAGLTRAQQADLEARDDFVARQILDAQTAQPSGIPTTNLTGIYTVGDDPMGDVRGFTDFGPTLPFLGPTQVYTGFGDNPFAPQEAQDEPQTTPPVTNPLTGRDQCPDGYVFDEDLQACRLKTRRELRADNGTGGGSSRPAGDMFFRRTSLDDAPANLPSGFDFDAANRAFTQSFAVRPSFFQRPPDLTGYTLL